MTSAPESHETINAAAPIPDYPAMAAAAGRIEPAPRRVRGSLGGEAVFDTVAARYVWGCPTSAVLHPDRGLRPGGAPRRRQDPPPLSRHGAPARTASRRVGATGLRTRRPQACRRPPRCRRHRGAGRMMGFRVAADAILTESPGAPSPVSNVPANLAHSPRRPRCWSPTPHARAPARRISRCRSTARTRGGSPSMSPHQ